MKEGNEERLEIEVEEAIERNVMIESDGNGRRKDGDRSRGRGEEKRFEVTIEDVNG